MKNNISYYLHDHRLAIDEMSSNCNPSFMVTIFSTANHTCQASISRIMFVGIKYLSASSECACFPAYSSPVFVNSFVITSCEISILLHSRSDITCLVYSTAPMGFLCKEICLVCENGKTLILLNKCEINRPAVTFQWEFSVSKSW